MNFESCHFSVTGYFGDFYGCEETCATNQVTFSCRNEETGVVGCMQITRAAYFCDVDSQEYGNVFNVKTDNVKLHRCIN